MVINRSMMLLAGAALVLIVALCLGNPFLPETSGDDPRGHDPQGMPTPEDGGPFGEAPAGSPEAGGVPGSGVSTGLADGQSSADSSDAPQDPGSEGDEGIGPCPEAYAGIPVVRRGLDELGRKTWWHADGSFTTQFLQTVKEANGSSYQVPAVFHAAPSGHRRR